MTKLHATLTALMILGGNAGADDAAPVIDTTTELSRTAGSARGVAQEYIVSPRGGELTGKMRFVTSQPSLGGEPLRFSDLALFGLAGRWSLLSKLELSANAEFLAKQPSFTDEKPWQSVGVGLRSPLAKQVAVSITGAGGHLVDHTGMWTRATLTLEWRKRISDLLTFDVAGGSEATSLSAPGAKGALVTELGVRTSALLREPTGHWGSWIGIGYGLPVSARGEDPTTGLAMDPQPRLDFRIGTVLSLVRAWDLFAEYAIVDRGDLAAPATRLPMLDGGFDQHQVLFGVTRHFTVTPRRSTHRDPMQMSVVVPRVPAGG